MTLLKRKKMVYNGFKGSRSLLQNQPVLVKAKNLIRKI